MRTTLFTLIKPLSLAALLFWAPCVGSAATTTLNVSPAAIVMGAQYNGVELTVSGEVPAESDLIIRLVGTPSELHLREKGKVFGLLWMNVGKVTLSNVPSVCLTSATRPLPQLGKAAAPYRLDALTKAIGVEEEGRDQSIDIPHQLLLLKSKEGLYREAAEGITLGPVKDGMQRYTAHIKVPSSLKPGEYKVEAVTLQDDAVIGEADTTIKAALSGFPKWLNDLAYQKSVLYGIMATVIAIASGLLIGLIFQSKEAH
ncbi:MAG: TIGR02186 family protein [Desulfobulbus sp.]|nr:TIGR02186 family protein [Desulfobulbus sp.]